MHVRVLLIAMLVLAATACGGDGGAEGSDVPAAAPATEVQAQSEPSAVPQVDVATREYAFDLPDQVEGGIIELNVANEGAVPHEVGLIKVSADYDLQQFGADFGPVLEGGPIPSVFENVTGVADVEGGGTSSTTITLPEGEYAVFCALTDPVEGEPPEGAGPPPHYEIGMLDRLRVVGGSDVTADAITGTDAQLSAFDYGFDADQLAELGAGTHRITFANTSDAQIHHAIVMGFPQGIDEAAAREAFAAMMAAGEGPPPEGAPEPEEAGFSAVYGPGMGGTFDLTLQSERVYAVVCFIQDRDGGPPHAVAHEMVTFFTTT
jgi:hypothetical protein